ncbi:MAG: UDP-N-acetylglucosamine 1-carboxyvinyltransferase [Chloroflexia bacterium]|jgi:UDP-N-acetylglucosamine 1-carboxyvinyltransferase|nr:UDP-N-acetylglucosamine 1-carboxyvinyltransferase [Chloroflexia bacterium]MDQ3612997.1 UDP-N-acetylglucosamine 1-carboxyvinyltransferase [Chloroflexota bacterium]
MSDIAAPTTATLTTERILKVRGGCVLRGDVFISGAKNAALKAMAATLLTRDEVVLNNVPMLADVLSMAELLRAFGAEVEVDRTQGRVTVQAREITRTSAPPDLFRPTRASVVAAGPMLARCGEVSFVMPGGDKIGRRPIDVHLRGFERMGATVEQTGDVIEARVDKLRGARIYMDYPSHTGTENLLMASTLAAGKTTIFNASAEPEVVWLGHLLNRMGARISGLGSPILTIDGVERLHGVSDYIIPDRLEAGSFAIGAVMTGGEVTLHDVREAHMLPLTEKLMEVGADVWFRQDRMLVRSGESLRSVDIQTLPFPGFPTDLQAPFTALLTQVSGVSRVHERVYEDRLRYTSELRKMGADIRVDRIGNASELLATSAEVHGPSRLRGARVAAIDIRAAICMVLAGLVADGETELEEVHHVDRGYENFVEKLTNIGGDVEDTVPNV